MVVVVGVEDKEYREEEGGEAESRCTTGTRASAARRDSLSSADLTFSRVQTLWHATAFAAAGSFRATDAAESHGGERLRS